MSINERVLEFLGQCQFAVQIRHIVFYTGLPRTQVKNAVMRLKHAERIKLVARYPSEYVVRRLNSA